MFKNKQTEAAADSPPEFTTPQVLYIPKPCFVQHSKWITQLFSNPAATRPYLEIAHDLLGQPWFKSRIFTIQLDSVDSISESDFLYAFGHKSAGKFSLKSETIIVGGRDNETPTSLGIHKSLFLEDGVFLNPFKSENFRYLWVKKPRGLFAENADIVLQMWEGHNSKAPKQIVAGFCFDFENGGKLFANTVEAISGGDVPVLTWNSLEECAFIVGTAVEALMKQMTNRYKYDTAIGIAMMAIL
ncbi:hypothetical protein HK100_000883 [Physocladia obscura]|uniref:Uncharacterized protein n=1 Tax=Physocladia obscura TaxID=109957 RepID=A0AAD5XBH0_9FUNG|nr:hypothetical protein HK100_000883 [Physocladia obscura]